MASEPKRRKIECESTRGPIPFPSEDITSTSRDKPTVLHAAQPSSINLRIQQARNLAVAQAQHCTANYRIFDSPFGNFLVPVIPTRAELGV
ncbi:hypothetical protein DM860_004092 [Cuscuta australis]|uniref:Uncharacterized protein n=1 Tax=Cuscuta australis TaxID=267555 RepID=A0A328CX17_9ASTE|nr:hypothetical protein DM860_004092 [Cuscuta australis]